MAMAVRDSSCLQVDIETAWRQVLEFRAAADLEGNTDRAPRGNPMLTSVLATSGNGPQKSVGLLPTLDAQELKLSALIQTEARAPARSPARSPARAPARSPTRPPARGRAVLACLLLWLAGARAGGRPRAVVVYKRRLRTYTQ
eukprot:TRINITY_DN41656_c0_g1_i1.p1 TRINITY_DN41656_c0_g1~~TRINITY_DN41656_c0_g1_i1.p1  ORF type:complete len:161 (+),score=13.34 TRINITY_DN41656_c0_g1_i1:56-484(+)